MFGTPTRYKPVQRSTASVLSPSKHNLFWNEVQTTCRTLLSVCCRYRAGALFDHLYWIEIHCLLVRTRLLIQVQTLFRLGRIGPVGHTYQLLTEVNTNSLRNYMFGYEKDLKINRNIVSEMKNPWSNGHLWYLYCVNVYVGPLYRC